MFKAKIKFEITDKTCNDFKEAARQIKQMEGLSWANTFQHDVDVVIEVPEKGKVVQMGRFNQGGEMNIFDGN